ncbi:MAG TPA: LLM class flavin-dependent oxidoreductase [Solirubrobacteraceae bacterium]|nr:LLM class flavin-dependent oxidoreductase [Solirubrobacteraceae bacterium]
MARVGLLFQPEWPPEELPTFARAAERDGFAELWVVEDCFLAGGPTMAVAALAATSRLDVGIGLLPVTLRNPALAAMEIAGVARMHPGRLTVTFGHGVEAWMRQIGARPPDRLVALEETVATVRALLAGETISQHGNHVHLDDVRLGHPPDPPPELLIGTTGPRGMAVASRVAEGVLLPEGSGPEAVSWARHAATPRRLVVYAWLSLDDDRDAALEAVRPRLERWLALGLYPRLSELASDLRSLAVVGDAEDCARAVERLHDAGADSVVLVPRLEDRDEQVARFAADVLPRL